jgi:hypothetical protein
VRTARRLVLPLALAGALLATFAAGASAAQKSIWGPTGDFAGCGGSCFPLYAQLGVDNVQFQIPWDTVARSRPANPRNPNDPAYRWPASGDYMVQQAAQYGISLGVLVQGTPSWANGGLPRAYVPLNLRDYADFMFAISRRYPTIHRWMIWGEPNYGLNFQPMPPNSRVGPRTYAKLLDLAYGALKRASRRNIVIGGMTISGGGPVSTPSFVKSLRVGRGKNARPPRMDLWGHNPFDGRVPNIKKKPIGRFRGLSDIDTLHREIQRAYGSRVKGTGRKVPKLWLSEWTVLTEPSPNLFGGFHVSPEQQATYVIRAYRMVQKLKYVKALGWYRLEDQANSGAVGAAWGLMTVAGEWKPSFNAYAAAH